MRGMQTWSASSSLLMVRWHMPLVSTSIFSLSESSTSCSSLYQDTIGCGLTLTVHLTELQYLEKSPLSNIHLAPFMYSTHSFIYMNSYVVQDVWFPLTLYLNKSLSELIFENLYFSLSFKMSAQDSVCCRLLYYSRVLPLQRLKKKAHLFHFRYFVLILIHLSTSVGPP